MASKLPEDYSDARSRIARREYIATKVLHGIYSYQGMVKNRTELASRVSEASEVANLLATEMEGFHPSLEGDKTSSRQSDI
jgi:hypothetical protein